jgi:hypothetical protein
MMEGMADRRRARFNFGDVVRVDGYESEYFVVQEYCIQEYHAPGGKTRTDVRYLLAPYGEEENLWEQMEALEEDMELVQESPLKEFTPGDPAPLETATVDELLEEWSAVVRFHEIGYLTDEERDERLDVIRAFLVRKTKKGGRS